MFSKFTYHKAIGLKIHWSFYKLYCNFVIILWPKSENHWHWATVFEKLHKYSNFTEQKNPLFVTKKNISTNIKIYLLLS